MSYWFGYFCFSVAVEHTGQWSLTSFNVQVPYLVPRRKSLSLGVATRFGALDSRTSLRDAFRHPFYTRLKYARSTVLLTSGLHFTASFYVLYSNRHLLNTIYLCAAWAPVMLWLQEQGSTPLPAITYIYTLHTILPWACALFTTVFAMYIYMNILMCFHAPSKPPAEHNTCIYIRVYKCSRI